MRLELEIALSHLLYRRRQSLVSVLGTAMGVGFFIAISSLMLGFQLDFVARVIDVQPHIVIKDEFRRPAPQPAEILFQGGAVSMRGMKPREEVRGLRGARAIMATLEAIEGVRASPVMSGQALIRYGGKDVSASVIGIDPTRERRVTNIDEDITEGSLDGLYTAANGIILGEGVARKAGVGLGDLVSVVSPEGVVLKMTVVGLFASGITQMDDTETYTLLKKAQILQDRPNVVNRIRIRLDDVEKSRDLSRKIEERFGYRTESWEEASSNVLGIFVIQRGIMFSTVGAILIVASFGIFNVISTVVFEKTRDIGILKSMGFGQSDIRRIFMLEGLMMGILGTLVGWALGYSLVQFLGSLEFKMTGFVKNEGFVMFISPLPYLAAGLFAILTATFAAWLPARRASLLKPVDIVRGSA